MSMQKSKIIAPICTHHWTNVMFTLYNREFYYCAFDPRHKLMISPTEYIFWTGVMRDVPVDIKVAPLV